MRVRTPNARAGFTLVEVLVTLVLIALLLGVIVPQVLNQLDRGDPTRVASDLESIRSGARLFRVDVKRYPLSLEQLIEDPSNGWDDSTDVNGATITAGLIARWNGPYLESGAVTDTSTVLETALGGSILPKFGVHALGGNNYLTVLITGLGATEIGNISEVIDGNTTISDDDAGGRLRSTAAGDTLLYLAIPIN